MTENRCLVCRDIIPEGREVCPNCEEYIQRPHNQVAVTRYKLTNKMWEIIRAEGIEITNQNIDWLLERVFKEIVKENKND